MSGPDDAQIAALAVHAVELETAGMARRKDNLLPAWGEGSVKTGGRKVGKLLQVAPVSINSANLVNLIHKTGEDDAARGRRRHGCWRSG